MSFQRQVSFWLVARAVPLATGVLRRSALRKYRTSALCTGEAR